MANSIKLISGIFKKSNSAYRALYTFRVLMLVGFIAFPVFGYLAVYFEPDISINMYEWYGIGILGLILFLLSFGSKTVTRKLPVYGFLLFCFVSLWILKLNYQYDFRISFTIGLMIIYFIICIGIRLTKYLQWYNLIMLGLTILSVFTVENPHVNPFILSFYMIVISIVSYLVLNARIKILDELEFSESLLFSVFLETEDAIYLLDDKTYEVLDCNRRGYEIFGFSDNASEETGRDSLDFISSELTEVVTADYSVQPTYNFIDRKLKNSKGQEIHVDVSSKLILFKKSRILLVRVTDVTDRMFAEQSLFDIAEQRTQLLNVSKTILSTLSVDDIVKQISASLDELLAFDACYLFWVNQQDKKLIPQVLKKSRFITESFENWNLNFGEGITGTIINSKKGELINYAHKDPRSIYYEYKDEMYEHLIAVPIISRNEIIAVFGVVRDQDPPFKTSEFELVQLFVSLASVAFENASLYQVAQKKAEHNKALIEVTNAISSTMKVNELLDLIVDRVLHITNSNHGGLFLLNTATEMLELVSSKGIPNENLRIMKIKVGESVAGWVAEHGESVLIHDVEQDSRYKHFVNFENIKSMLSVPLIHKGKLIGVLGADRLQGEEYFNNDDLEIAKDFANQAVLAIENARLFEEIKISEEKYRTLFEETEEVVILSSPEGKILDINPSGVRLFGFDSKFDMLGLQSVSELYFNSEDRQHYLSEMINKGQVKNLEVEMRTREGKKIVVLESSVCVKNEKGEIQFFRGIIRDITEKRRLEYQFIQSQKMESIGLLAGGIAHDFNNILSGILGYSSLIKTSIDETHQFYKFVDSIEVSAKRAAELTSQLLAFARGGKYLAKKFNLNDVISETMTIIDRTIDKAIEIELFLSENLPLIEGDPVQMQQVVLNLCVNARDAINGQGKIIIETTDILLGENDSVLKNNLKSGLFVMLSVTDTGSGMDKETMTRIFEPFFTTKEIGQGTGLGLAMVYGVVKNHEGTINVYSEIGKGTTFRVYLPAQEAAALPVNTEPNNGAKKPDQDLQSHDNALVLVVDDEESLRSLLYDTLTGFGYRVVTASNGLEAVDIYKDQMNDISLVILDIVMPKLGGFETFVELQKINPKVKTILSSGFSQNMQTQDMLKNGVKDFIQKPFQVKDLLRKVKAVLLG